MIRQNQDVIQGLCSPAFLKPFGAEQRGPGPGPGPAPACTARGPTEPCDRDVTPPSLCLAPQQPRNTRLLHPKGAAGSWCLRAAASCLWGGAQHPSGMCFLAGLAMEPLAIQTLPCPSCPTLLSNQTPAPSRSQRDGRHQAKHLCTPHPCRTDSSRDLLPLIFSLPSPQTRAPTGDLFYWLFIATVMARVRTVSSAQTNTAEFSILLLIITAQKLAMETRRKRGCSGRDGEGHPQCPQESPQWL